MSRKKDFVERRFLNQGNYHSTAAIVAKIEQSDYSNHRYCSLFISDCESKISLEVDSDSQKDIENSIYKMNQLIEVAEIMKGKLEEMIPESIKRDKEREEKLAQKEKE